MKILLVNGPNLKLLGTRRRPYGSETLDQIVKNVCDYAASKGGDHRFGAIGGGSHLPVISAAHGEYDGMIILPPARTQAWDCGMLSRPAVCRRWSSPLEYA